MGHNRAKDGSRVPGRFVAIPVDVMESAAWRSCPHTALSLLMELALQYRGSNNGRLLASREFFRNQKRGWTSPEVLTRATRDLKERGLIFQTVQGHAPNRASWYALTWYTLDASPKYDVGATLLFKKGAYRDYIGETRGRATRKRGKNSPSSDVLISGCIDTSNVHIKRPIGRETVLS